MPIIRQLTEAEADQNWLESLIVRKAEAMNHFASVSKSVNDEFWAIDPIRLVALLNSNIERSLSIMQNDLAVNAPINAGLDAINITAFSARAPLGPNRSDIVFNGMTFVHVPPENPEEIPES